MGTYDLTTTALVKTYEGITAATDDTLIGYLIEKVTALFESYCGRKFLTRVYDPDSLSEPDISQDDCILDGLENPLNRKILYLPQRPIITITTVKINETAYTESTDVYTSGWYIHNRKAGALGLRGYDWLAGARNIKIKYTAGYATIPYDLAYACIEQVVWSFKQGKKEHKLGLTSINLAEGSIGLVTGPLLPSVKQVLNLYRNIAI